MAHEQTKPLMQDIPDGPWMRRLKEANWIWLAKEQEYATVTFPWQPPEPGFSSGRLVITRCQQWHDGFHMAGTQVWYVGSRGEGLDGKQLIIPCEGFLSETYAEYVDENIEKLMATIENLKTQVHDLTYRVRKMENNIGIVNFSRN